MLPVHPDINTIAPHMQKFNVFFVDNWDFFVDKMWITIIVEFLLDFSRKTPYNNNVRIVFYMI